MPCDYSKYPADWAQIRARILERAGNRCERCRASNHAAVSRRGDEYMLDDGSVYSSVDGTFLRRETLSCCGHGDWKRAIKIVLTIAHLDHDTTHNAPSNLRAWCQSCHLRYDLAEHKRHAAETRRGKLEAAGQLTLGVTR